MINILEIPTTIEQIVFPMHEPCQPSQQINNVKKQYNKSQIFKRAIWLFKNESIAIVGGHYEYSYWIDGDYVEMTWSNALKQAWNESKKIVLNNIN